MNRNDEVGVFAVIARFRKEPWQSVFGNEPHWIASACRNLAMTREAFTTNDVRLAFRCVIARFPGEPWQSVFDNEPQWIASAYRLAMTAPDFLCPRFRTEFLQ